MGDLQGRLRVLLKSFSFIQVSSNESNAADVPRISLRNSVLTRERVVMSRLFFFLRKKMSDEPIRHEE